MNLVADTECSAPDFSDIRAVYFDLDDTLCAYWDASKVGLRAAFDAHPVPSVTTEEMVRHWAASFRDFAPTLKQTGWYEGYLKSGAPTRFEQMRLTLQRVGIEDKAHAQNLSAFYMNARDKALALFPDALDLLEYLAAKYPMGLITNGPADIQRQEVITLNLEVFFKHIFIEGEVGEGKPLQSVFRRAEQAVGCQPHEIVYIGNSYDHDMAPAIAAGWRTVWIRRASDVPPSADLDKDPKPKEKPAGAPDPDAVVDNLAVLRSWL
jgi:putative hydrolase of the HAD superfamily